MSVEETAYVFSTMQFCHPRGLSVEASKRHVSIVNKHARSRVTFDVPMLPMLRELVAHLEAAEAQIETKDLAPAESE